MGRYIFGTAVIFMSVELLLLVGAESLCGFPPRFGRLLLASAAGGIYAGLCLLPRLHFLGGSLWRILMTASVCALGFGLSRSALRRAAVFVVLTLALNGILAGLEDGANRWLVPGALGLCVACRCLLRGKVLDRTLVTVELNHKGASRTLTALLDTGNTLTDPITGKQVLVADGKLGWELCGLTQRELADPVAAMEKSTVPGLRLIPYRAVGKPSGMLLAVRMDEVRIQGKKSDLLVAFAPQRIGVGEGYQALAGGII